MDKCGDLFQLLSVDSTVSEIATLIGGTIASGDPETVITGFAALHNAGAEDLSFLAGEKFVNNLKQTEAGAVLISESENDAAVPESAAVIMVGNASRAFDQVVDKYGLQERPFKPGIHPSAVIADSAVLDPEKVAIGPNAVVDDGAELGDGVNIGAGAYVGPNVRIGKDAKLFANATVHEACVLGKRVILHSAVVVGGDGFGYYFEEGIHRKVRQSGIVQIDDDVEIGAGSTIDRARFGKTWIGEGTKIDCLVQIAHNVVIGKHCILVAATAVAGSCRIGNYVVMAAQSGAAGHITIGDKSIFGGRSGVTKSLPGGENYLGYPALPLQEEMRRRAASRSVPRLISRVKELERRLEELEGKEK